MDGLIMKYFVLNPTKNNAYGKASRSAILVYALAISHKNPNLAKGLREWLGSLERKAAGNNG